MKGKRAMRRWVAAMATSLILLPFVPVTARAGDDVAPQMAALIRSYPEFLDRVDGNELVWKDGTRMTIDDGRGAKSLDEMLDVPDIKDMFKMAYPLGDKGVPPAVDFDPGRVRYLPLLKKVYGDCVPGRVGANAVDVSWLPRHGGKSVKFSGINGAAAALTKVSEELDKLPDRFMDFLRPIGGTYNCRPIAGTNRLSAHGLGIAIDIATARSDYWRWAKDKAGDRIPYRNRIPPEIVRIFENHNFVWGGKWYHYDTMHFEYRPEILATAK
jgi:D-alanyl-D-alanine carboxypeptidase-like protein